MPGSASLQLADEVSNFSALADLDHASLRGFGITRRERGAAQGHHRAQASTVGEHLGQAFLGLQTIGAGVQTRSPGLVFDGYGDALAGVWKLAADRLMVRGLRGGLRGRNGCFVAGTLVETASGPRPIEELAVGDIVLAQDIETGKAVWREILNTKRREAVQTLELVLEYVDDDGALSSETLVLTEEHPLWAEDLGDWLAAGKVELGQRLSTLTGVGTVVGIELGQVRDVFNLEVEGAHNYFAGDGGVLAHNGVCGETSYFDAHVKAWRARQAAKGGGRWKVGDNVYAPTRRGQPSWSTVRSRHWKNRAAEPGALEEFGAENVERMSRGRAPQRYNPDKGGMESMELSHEPVPAREGGTAFVERWPQDHARVDPYRRPGY